MSVIKTFVRQLMTAVHQPQRIHEEITLQIARLGGQVDYSRFIVLTRSRAGSNLLINALASNPAIQVKGEIFKTLKGKKPSKVFKKIFCRKPKNIKSVGFKIFYYHPLDADSNSTWGMLENDNKIRVIHLRRRNLLRVIVSKKMAELTGVWGQRSWQKNNVIADRKKVTIDCKDMICQFQETLKWQEEFQRRFAGHRIMDVWYEDIIKDIDCQIEQITSFLSVKYLKPFVTIRKQNKEPIAELIENYSEVEDALSGTQWESFLLDYG